MSAGDDLIDGARRVAKVIRELSPGVQDGILAGACLIAAGILKSSATFPDLPPSDKAGDDAGLFLAGMHIGRDNRVKLEKESCQGAA